MSKNWSKNPLRKGDRVSVVFSWQLWDLINAGPSLFDLIYGGPALKANLEWIPDWMKVENEMPFLQYHNSQATRTSLGCPRNCGFCIVNKIEPIFKELEDWEVKPIVIDNNLLACSQAHFDKVIDSLKKLDWCDFNQGLDARLLTNHHVQRLSELKNPMIRLAFDSLDVEKQFLEAHARLKAADIPNRNIGVYVLIGYKDDPGDALYRLKTVKELGILPFPMRYQPTNTKVKNSYVGPGWTNKELIRYMRYWSRLRFTNHIPFKEFGR